MRGNGGDSIGRQWRLIIIRNGCEGGGFVVSEVDRTIVAADGQWRVDIIRRSNGTFGFQVFRWHDDDQREGPHWCFQGGYSACVTASADDAEREARSRVEGLRIAPQG